MRSFVSRARVFVKTTAGKEWGSMSDKYIYSFGAGKADGTGKMKELLGGKGANLAEMTRIGVPVPPGFTIGTDVCLYYSRHHGRYPGGVKQQVAAALKKVESIMGTSFGDTGDPLLFSVRSGANRSRASLTRV